MTAGGIPAELAFFCAVLSPFAGEEEMDRWRGIVCRGEVAWEKVADYANRHNLAPALSYSLREKGMAGHVPSLFLDFLDEMHRFNRQRNDLLLHQVLEVTRLLNGAGILPLWLKGGAALVTDLFPDHGVRFMWDLDVLVPPERMEQCVALMQAGGYAVPKKYANAQVFDHEGMRHYPPLLRPDSAAPVELHRCLMTGQFDALLSPESVWGESRRYSGDRLPGGVAKVMAPEHEIIHCFAHSELVHRNRRDFRLDLRQLHQFSVLCHRQGIDWIKIHSTLVENAAGGIFYDFASLADLLFGIGHPIPLSFEKRAEGHRSRVIRTQSGRQRRRQAPRLLAIDLARTFRERLSFVLASDDVSIRWRRLRHFICLLGRHCRPVVWKNKWRKYRF